mgnify:CR=1 FL=1
MEDPREPSPVQVLYVTTDAARAAAAASNLPAHGPIEVVTESSVADAVAVVRETDVDCILSDQNLPDADGITLLQVVRSQRPDPPVFLFADEGRDAVASRALAAGVTESFGGEDPRERWSRLAELVESAVRQHRCRTSLVDAPRRAETVLRGLPDPVVVLQDGAFSYLNEAGKELLAVEAPEDLRGTRLDEWLGPDETAAVEDRLAAIRNGDRNVDRFETRIVGNDGVERDVRAVVARIDWHGDPAVLLIVREVAERTEPLGERALFRRLIDRAQDSVLVIDDETAEIVEANDVACESLGYDRGRLLGMAVPDVSIRFDDREEYLEFIETTGEDRDSSIEDEHLRADGTTVPVEVSATTVKVDGVAYRIATARDVSDRLERERRLRRYEQAVEQSTDMMVAIDDDYTLLFANRRYREFYDLSPDDVGDVTLPETVGERVFSEIEPHLEAAERGNTVEFDMKRRGPDGDLRTLEIRYYQLGYGSGSVEWGVATMRDVTDSVEAKAELRTYEEIVERVDDPIMLQALDGTYRVVNEAVTRYAGLSEAELIGNDESAFVDDEMAAEIAAMKRQVVDEERPVTYEVSLELPAMGERTFATTRYPHYDEDGDIDGTVAICRDVTERRDRERQLQVLDRVLRHNLHNEMNVVMGHAEQILEAPDGDHAAFARQILDSGRDLVDMANKERRIVKLLSEEPTLETIALRPLLSELVAALNESHPGSRVTLECPLDARATADRSIASAFRELIENGIVHNDGDRPEVLVSVERENGMTRVVVADDGPGIPAEEQLVLTGEADIQPLFHGSGLGLWLVNHVVRRSNGTLRFLESDEAGTTVELLLPAQ